MREIKIENTKGIKKLVFHFPDEKGVYLLVGANGVGKTTLLTCMERICNPLAFAKGFTTTKSWNEVDQFANATIQYTTDTACVRFRKKTAKWAPTPKRGSSAILSTFGFSSVIFIRADAGRIAINQDDLRAGNFVAADREIKSILNSLMETNKYSHLMRLRNANGRGRQATFFYVVQDSNGVYSEKRFSTGELALLRLVEQLQNVDENALILLDEAELALHPRVQTNLIKYLCDKARDKNITIFVSTHSPAMIKTVSKEHIIKLNDQGNGTIHVVTPCYPASAIGCVDFESSSIFDYIFFVEDDMPRTILKAFLKRYIVLEPDHATALTSIIPVGGYFQTADMAVRTRQQVFSQSKVYALLDQDAFENIEENAQFNALYTAHRDIIRSLTFTPEVWIIEKLVAAENDFKRDIRTRFHAELDSIFASEPYRDCSSTNPRKLAKKQLSVVLDAFCAFSGDNSSCVEISLIDLILSHTPDAETRQVLGPILGMRN